MICWSFSMHSISAPSGHHELSPSVLQIYEFFPFISIIFMPNYIYTTKTILVDTSHTLLKYVFIGKKIIACFHLYYQNPSGSNTCPIHPSIGKKIIAFFLCFIYRLNGIQNFRLWSYNFVM